jgi:hypothetical protein
MASIRVGALDKENLETMADFFNRIGRELPAASVINERLCVGQDCGLEFKDRTPSSQTSLFLYYFRESSQCQRAIALLSLHAEGTLLEE